MSFRVFRYSYLVIVLLATMSFASPGCGSKSRGASVKSPTPIATPTPKQRLDAAADRMQTLDGFHFLLTHENGASTIALGLQMTKADGDFQKPDRFKANVNAKFQSIPVSVKVINVADKTWITNPLQAGDHYQPLPNGTQATAILDPNTGLLKAARDVQQPQLTGSEKIGNGDSYIVQGSVDAGELQSLATDAQPGRLVPIRVWIGKGDSLLYRIRLEGPLSDNEPRTIVRQIECSQFNEKLDIQPPS
ncbi:MAG: LppX_LprAFG lipoprotein [Dehalococcoidia bacterium]